MFDASVREVCVTTPSSVPHLVEFCPATLKAFVETHAFEVDNQPFSFADHQYLIPIFETIRFDHGESWSGVLQSGAQSGKSITAILALTMSTVTPRLWGRNFGYLLPDFDLASIFIVADATPARVS